MRSFILSLWLIFSLFLAACGGQQDQAAAPDPAAEQAGGEAADTAGGSTNEEEAAPAADPSTGVGEYTLENPPEVFNAEAVKQYAGAELRFFGDAVGLGSQMDQAVLKKFSDATGVQVRLIPRPQDATETYAVYQRLFQARSSEIDVMMVDVIWPGALAPHLLDLSQILGAEAQKHYPTIIENNTVDGRLVAMPWFADFGMLYYRTDLLEKYGFDGPPATWDELEEMSRTVQEGERAAGNAAFWAFVWQGSAYEGLTCNALEWIYTHGGGTILNEDGTITVNNPEAVQAINRAGGWVGTISPRGVVSYREEEARNVFQGGNAVFMRNWPYAYAAGQTEDSPIRGKFDVAPLPVGNNGEPAGTVGGWQLGISAYSQNREVAVELVRYMTSPQMQIWRAAVGTFVPTIPEISDDPAVLEAMPFLDKFTDVTRVTRPSAEAQERYNEVSTIFFQSVNQVLLGKEAENLMPQLAQRLERIVQ